MSKAAHQGRAPLPTSAAAPGSSGVLNDLQAEVSVEAAPLLQYIARHAAVIMVVLGLCVVTVAGVGAWQWHATARDDEARTQFARLLLRERGAARVGALEGFATTAPDSLRLAALMELGLAALAEQDAAKAAAAFARVAALDAGNPLGTAAALSEAHALMRAGKAAEAVTMLEALENTVPEQMRRQVRGLIALNARQAGNTDRALKAYEDLLAGALGDDADYYRFCIRQIRADAAKQP